MQLKNMVSALFQSRDAERGGTRHFSIKGLVQQRNLQIEKWAMFKNTEIESKPHSQRFMDSSQCSAFKSYAGMLFLLLGIEYYAVS